MIEQDYTKIAAAFEAAAICHRTHKRKGKNDPYIVHPIRVAMKLISLNANVNMACAGALHDVLEMCPENRRKWWKDKILHEFGPMVGTWVEFMSGSKEQLLAVARNSESTNMLAVMLADKLDNLQDIARDLEACTTHHQLNHFWSRFNSTPVEIASYYVEMAKIMTDKALIATIEGQSPRLLIRLLNEFRPLVQRYMVPWLVVNSDDTNLLVSVKEMMKVYQNETGMSDTETREFVTGCLEHILGNPEINQPIMAAFKSAEVVG